MNSLTWLCLTIKSFAWLGMGNSFAWLGLGNSLAWLGLGNSLAWLGLGNSLAWLGLGNSLAWLGLGEFTRLVRFGGIHSLGSLLLPPLFTAFPSFCVPICDYILLSTKNQQQIRH